jgi:hypothetical protein
VAALSRPLFICSQVTAASSLLALAWPQEAAAEQESVQEQALAQEPVAEQEPVQERALAQERVAVQEPAREMAVAQERVAKQEREMAVAQERVEEELPQVDLLPVVQADSGQAAESRGALRPLEVDVLQVAEDSFQP